jgi:hypothetical protein
MATQEKHARKKLRRINWVSQCFLRINKLLAQWKQHQRGHLFPLSVGHSLNRGASTRCRAMRLVYWT